jgi:hypothetical protein
MVEQGHAREVVADLGRVGRAAVQEHVTDRPAVEPGGQKHPASVLLPGQPVGEEAPLPKDRHQLGEVGRSGSPDLHRTRGSAVVRLLEAAPHPATLAGPGDHVTAFSPRP